MEEKVKQVREMKKEKERREKEGKRTPAAGLGGGFSQQRLADGVMARAPEDLDQ